MRVPQGLVDVSGAVRLEGRGIVDQESQRTEQSRSLFNQSSALATIGEISLDDFGPSTGVANAVAHGAGACFVGAEMDDHGMTGFGQGAGDGRANTVTGASHKGDCLILIREWKW